jgi:hypothetical protein
MEIRRSRRPAGLVLIVLLLASLACRVEMPRIVLEESPTPTLVPTQISTIVITEIITPTPEPIQPTAPPAPTTGPTVKPTFDPFSAPIYYPLPDCVASRLHVGDTAMVSFVGGANGIRTSADVSIDNIEAYAQPGDQLIIMDGPWCSYGTIVWLVKTGAGYIGFTPEGNGEVYWLLPVK